MNREQVYSKIEILVRKFEENKHYYLSKNYFEEEVKIDFINPLFEALGWDVRNTKGLSPYEREVVVEKGDTEGRPDYNFRIDGQTKFFLEAKAPHELLHKINHVLQAKSYAWNTKNVFIVLLADFEELRLFDATIKPNPKNPDQGLIFELTYDRYLDNLDKLMLLSKEEVESGSLDKLILQDPMSKKLRIPVDKAFLEDISKWREDLARDIYKLNIKELEIVTHEKREKIRVKILNEAVQKILDRLIFIRITEDRKIIEPKSLLDEVEWWKAGGKRRDLQRRLTNRFMGWNQDFNGEILKPGPCDVLKIDSHLLAKIIESLYFPKCPYRFDVIGVELLGSIYERYLGKTIRVTPKRVKIEEKPEVKKAGGVYYTPQYIVDYIVKNTVDKIIKGKTPKQIEKIKILDPACGSGSFLLTAFKTLIDYHLDYYEKHPKESGEGMLFPNIIIDYSGAKRLSIEKKAHILRNNIFGVDIDPQAVEIAMMSLYLKCLESEKDLPQKKELLPSLAKNILCGNSLISYDIFNQLTLFDDEEKDDINPFDWHSKSTGFGEIMEKGGFDVVIGNPPYLYSAGKKYIDYFEANYKLSQYQTDFYVYFIEKALSLIRKGGKLSFIVSDSWLNSQYFSKMRNHILAKHRIDKIAVFNYPVFPKVTLENSIMVLTVLKMPNAINVDRFSRPNSHSTVNKIKPEDAMKRGLIDPRYSSVLEQIITKIEKDSHPLEKYVRLNRGIHAYRTDGYGKSKFGPGPQTKKDKELSSYHTETALDKTYLPELRGRHVYRYFFISSGKYLSYGPWLAEPRTPDFFYKPKIILRKVLGKKLHGTFIEEPTALDQSLYIIISKKGDPSELKYFLGVLLSYLGAWYLRTKYAIYDRIYPWYTKKQLAEFPLKEKKNDKIIYLVDKILELNRKKNALPSSSAKAMIEREISITDEKIDNLVYELYRITKEEKNIIEASGSQGSSLAFRTLNDAVR